MAKFYCNNQIQEKTFYPPEETMVVMGITKMSIIELYGQEKFLATRIAEVIELLETRYPFLISDD
ncbi:MAG TPA: hypothetical protein DDY13_19205 [Cytophagales bacterium]|jgi:hypothetical protein|nr:hypothetical protein [Cytophagales bacterium]